MGSIRLDRYLADVHIASRKVIKELLRDGRISVNGETVTRAETRVDPEADKVTFDNETLLYSKHRYYMLNKPAGVVTATKDGLSRTVIELLKNVPVRNLSPAGRLDKDTEGLLLITDDGALIHHLISPSHRVEKVYEVHLATPLSEDAVTTLTTGVDIGDDTKTLPARCERMENDAEGREVLRLTITEGRFHQIRRMVHAVGSEVAYLKRLSMGTLILDPALKPGAYRPLSSAEITALREHLTGDAADT